MKWNIGMGIAVFLTIGLGSYGCSSDSGDQSASSYEFPVTPSETKSDGPRVPGVLDALGALDADADADAGNGEPVEFIDLGETIQCAFPVKGYSSGSVSFERAFPNLTLSYPLAMMPAGDGTGRLYAAEQAGKIRRFPNIEEVALAKIVLDVSSKVTGLDGEGGLLGLAFDPNFATNGYFYLNYTTGNSSTFRNSISRFTADFDNDGLADLASEKVIMEIPQPFWNHNGGWVAFGPDGLLYIGTGDGGAAGDPLGSGQDVTTLLGAMLRIDVSTVDATGSYGIPADNPFANGEGGARPEIYAWGLRNPWRYAFDSIGGTLYVADVGQDKLEEVNVLTRGGNFGWNIMEGSACYPSWSSCESDDFISPVAEYNHTVGLSITGGEVVRGNGLPSLYGSYIYADYETFETFAYPAPAGAGPNGEIGLAPGPIAGFGRDSQGEVYALQHWSGEIYRLVEAPPTDSPAQLPELLSETGCFSELAGMTPAPNVRPYDVTIPFWSDGAEKKRWVHVPSGSTLGTGENGTLVYPVGSAFIKHFEIPQASGDLRRLETRVLVVTEDGVQGFSYRWNEEGTDAILLDGPLDETFDTPAEGGPTEWHYPSRNECRVCHTESTQGVLGADELGLLTASTTDWGQLSAWIESGEWVPGGAYLEPPYPHFPSLESEASTEDQARGYLHVNCAGCHRPGGPAGARSFDLRATTPFAEMGICNQEPLKSTLGIEGAFLLAPGQPDKSLVAQRMHRQGEERMPPLGTTVLDIQGITVLETWIGTLEGCEGGR